MTLIAHSKSPEIHRRFGDQFRLGVAYEKVHVNENEFESKVQKFFLDGGHGLSITVPHKWSAFQIANELSDEALLAGACNTLMVSDDGLYGHNTDGLGLIDDLDRLGWSPTGKRILLLGAGGAVAGCLGPLVAREPEEVVIANRSVEKVRRIVDRFDQWGSRY